MTDIQIAFPKVEIPVMDTPARTPEKAVGSGLVTFSKSEANRQGLVCKDRLVGQTRQNAEAEAEQLYIAMLDNRQIVATYGSFALEDINQLVDRLLHEVEPQKIPQLTNLMKDLNHDMRGVRRKYDVSDPKVLEKYENFKGGIGRFFGTARTLVELLMEDVSSLEKQIDRISATLEKKSENLFENVEYYDALYDENEAAVSKLIYAIGVLEFTRDVAVREANNIVIGDASLGDRGAERQARIAGLANQLEIQINEYKGRLFVAWSTSPQVRMMGDLSLSVAIRLRSMLFTVIPTMKATIVQWRLLMETFDGAKMGAVVGEAQNEWLKAYSDAGAKAAPIIAEVANTPTLRPDTMYAMAASIELQADGIIKAIEAGAKQRAAVESAMVEIEPILKNAAQRVSQATIDRIVTRAQQPLEISTTVLSEDANKAA
ncbi:MAG: toxic anion resistance protein [Candidatus Saccharimonadaceae bacterium]